MQGLIPKLCFSFDYLPVSSRYAEDIQIPGVMAMEVGEATFDQQIPLFV